MNQVPDHMTRSRKAGMEDIILMRLPADRFYHHLPLHYAPPVDKRSRVQVALVVQSCERNSYDSHETGLSGEFHFWLKTASTGPGETANGRSIILPTQQWFSLGSASGNPEAIDYLQTFGFSPLILDKVDLLEKGGAVSFRDRGEIQWTIIGGGKEFERVGVDHVLKVGSDGPETVGHQIAASVSNPVMDQPGRVHIRTSACEPFLYMGEKFAAIVHRMTMLEANIEWQLHPE